MTDKELLEMEQKEHDHALETVSAVYLLLETFNDNISHEFNTWYRKYSKNGMVKYSDSRKYLSNKELRTFNRKYGTGFKRLRRDKALFFTYSYHTNSFLSSYVNKLHDLGVTIVGYEAGQFQVDLDTEDVLATKWGQDDTTYVERVNKRHSQILYDLQKETTRGLVTGAQPETIITALVAVGDSLKRGISTLVLTEATAFAANAKMRVYETLFPNKRYQNVEVMDERTCEVCAAINGKVFPMKSYEVGVTAPPYHPRCRGTTKIVD